MAKRILSLILGVVIAIGFPASMVALVAEIGWLVIPLAWGVYCLVSGLVFSGSKLFESKESGFSARKARRPFLSRIGDGATYFVIQMASIVSGPLPAAVLIRALGKKGAVCWFYAVTTNLVTSVVMYPLYLLGESLINWIL